MGGGMLTRPAVFLVVAGVICSLSVRVKGGMTPEQAAETVQKYKDILADGKKEGEDCKDGMQLVLLGTLVDVAGKTAEQVAADLYNATLDGLKEAGSSYCKFTDVLHCDSVGFSSHKTCLKCDESTCEEDLKKILAAENIPVPAAVPMTEAPDDDGGDSGDTGGAKGPSKGAAKGDNNKGTADAAGTGRALRPLAGAVAVGLFVYSIAF